MISLLPIFLRVSDLKGPIASHLRFLVVTANSASFNIFFMIHEELICKQGHLVFQMVLLLLFLTLCSLTHPINFAYML